jgi:hypothetical protein
MHQDRGLWVMNNKFRELAEQAELNATLLFNKEKLEQFANLIIRECTQFVGDEDSIKVKQMKHYFGVE